MSALGIAANCQYLLRPDVEWPDTKQEDSAAFGSAGHGVFYAHATKGEQAAKAELAAVPSQFYDNVAATYSQWKDWYNALPIVDRMHAEVAIKYNPFTGKGECLIGMPGPRRYLDASNPPNPDCEIAGTSDLVLEHDGKLENIDYKTGQMYVSPDSPQMCGLGTGIAATFGATEITSTVVTAHTDRTQPESAHWTQGQLESFRESAKALLEADVMQARPNPGAHCRFCPARDACPATLALVGSIELQTAGDLPGLSINITPANAARAVSQVAVARAFLDNVEEKLKAFAESTQSGIDLGNGSTYAGLTQQYTYPNITPAVESQLRQAGLGLAIKRTTTWADLERVGGKAGLAKAKEILSSLGAIGTYSKKVFRIRKTKLEK